MLLLFSSLQLLVFLFHLVFIVFSCVESSDALIRHLGYKLHDMLQLKQGCFPDSSDAKIVEMIKSNNLDVS